MAGGDGVKLFVQLLSHSHESSRNPSGRKLDCVVFLNLLIALDFVEALSPFCEGGSQKQLPW